MPKTSSAEPSRKTGKKNKNAKSKPKKQSVHTGQSQAQKQVINITPYRAKPLRTPTAYGGSPNRPYPINFSVISQPTLQTPINQYDVPSITNQQLALENAYKTLLQQQNEAKVAQKVYSNVKDVQAQTDSPTPPSSGNAMDASFGSTDQVFSFSLPSSSSPPSSALSDVEMQQSARSSMPYGFHNVHPDIPSPHQSSSAPRGASLVVPPSSFGATIGASSSRSLYSRNSEDTVEHRQRPERPHHMGSSVGSTGQAPNPPYPNILLSAQSSRVSNQRYGQHHPQFFSSGSGSSRFS